MRLEFARSAARHGISRERAAYVVAHTIATIFRAPVGRGEVTLFLGLDPHGVPLEIGVVESSTDELLVIHAMPLRRSLLSALREGLQ